MEDDSQPITALIRVGPDMYREVKLSHLQLRATTARTVDKYLAFPNFVDFTMHMLKAEANPVRKAELGNAFLAVLPQNRLTVGCANMVKTESDDFIQLFTTVLDMPGFTHAIGDMHGGELAGKVFDELKSRGYTVEALQDGIKTINDSEIIKM